MIVNTKAIVLSALKYGDNSLIIKCITKKMGVKSYLVQGIFSTKKGNLKPAYFQVFNLLDLVATHKNQGTLGRLKDARVDFPLHSLHTNIYKSSIIMFLSEICVRICNFDYTDEPLYNFMEKSIVFFEKNDFSPNFHLKFLIEFTRYIGIYPHILEENKLFFDIEEGKMRNEKYSDKSIDGEMLYYFKQLLTTDFEKLIELKMSRKIRHSLLSKILDYYEWHNPGFKKNQSLEIFNMIFN